MTPAIEEWRPALGYEGLYEVSDQGRVRSVDRVVVDSNGRRTRVFRGLVLSPFPNPNGYLNVSLRRDGSTDRHKVHQLVADAFDRPRPSPSHVVRHLNGVPTDNRAGNVVWGTILENADDKRRHGTHHNAVKTHCPAGHEYTPENTRVVPSRPSARYCRPCQRDRYRANRERING